MIAADRCEYSDPGSCAERLEDCGYVVITAEEAAKIKQCVTDITVVATSVPPDVAVPVITTLAGELVGLLREHRLG